MLQKLKDKIKSITYKLVPPPYVPASYAQAGEDAVVWFLFHDRKEKQIQYLDLGTNKPDYCNNTYLFYKNGFSGVCVEADSSLITEIEKVRPLDKVIHAGVSVSNDKEADFYIFDEPSINTFDKAEAENRSNSGTNKIIKIIKVKLIAINDLIRENFQSYPDYLSIDIEGLDLDVLKSLDYEKFPIPVICVETCGYSENYIRPKDHSINEYLSAKGYEVYADTYINTIFVNREWFYKQ